MKAKKLSASLSALLIILLLPQLVSHAQDGRRPDLVGRYSYSHEFGGSSVTLAEDGSYTAVGVDCTESYTFKGSYVVNDGVVVLTPKSGAKQQHGSTTEETIFPPKDATAAAETKAERYVLITWGERHYLVGEDDVRAFCNAANLGVEPRKDMWKDAEYMSIYRLAYLGIFYLRDGDEEKQVTGLPEVPAQWKSYLLKKPVGARVLSVEADRTATISAGVRQGLKVGMLLAVEGDDAPSIWSGAEVISVGEAASKVRGVGLAVGARVSTKYHPRKLE